MSVKKLTMPRMKTFLSTPGTTDGLDATSVSPADLALRRVTPRSNLPAAAAGLDRPMLSWARHGRERAARGGPPPAHDQPPTGHLALDGQSLLLRLAFRPPLSLPVVLGLLLPRHRLDSPGHGAGQGRAAHSPAGPGLRSPHRSPHRS